MSAETDEMPEILREFLAESAEGLERIDRHLVELERDPSPERLAEIFRALHTLKGSSGMLGYPKLEALAHAGESVLSALQDGELIVSSNIITSLLAALDSLRSLLQRIKSLGCEATEDYGEVIGSLGKLLQSAAPPSAVQTPARDLSVSVREKRATAGGSTIRVDVCRLDRLMELSGELVLTCNQILHLTASPQDDDHIRAAQRLKRITSNIQDAVMQARLQSIGSVWNQVPRLARDLALACGKQVTVEMEGSETELDRGMLEAIRDPLTHVLRNAIAHGIESPEQRLCAGKSPSGRLLLRAFHREGCVHIEISDDGAGVDLQQVRQHALQRKLITLEESLQLDERELANLVFLPGFSTAETVTNVAGRGVGLDIVRANIQRIGGEVSLRTLSGQGTALHFRIPLTLAIVPALMVSSGGQRFAIPQADLLEVASLSGTASIERVCNAAVYRLRDRLLPLCFLDRELGLKSKGGEGYVVVVRARSVQFGLVVNSVDDAEEIVVKPLEEPLSRIACYAGAAASRDGRVVLILDVNGLAVKADVATCAPVEPVDDKVAARNACGSTHKWLLFRSASGSRFALPLAAVVRLEEIPAERIEHSEGREVVRYGGDILPLLRVSRIFHEWEPERNLLTVAIIGDSESRAALAIDRIDDIVQETVEIRRDSRSRLLDGSVVIQRRVADVLNIKSVMAYLKALES